MEEILCNDYFFLLVVGGRRIVIFRRKVYEPLFKGIRERFGMARATASTSLQSFNSLYRDSGVRVFTGVFCADFQFSFEILPGA